ncbi:M91 family zinc metallopeptidase [Nocardioides conyzicola]|uniref:Calcium-binding protein n=1 Tax=Nocardioides conyzicola TaxID=1651781 RepID=A0ABP8XIW0_9ACTN
MPEGIFDLHDEAARLDTASTAWADLASGITTASDGVDEAARTARDAGWEGKTAESYDAHRKSLVADLDTASGLAESLASTLSAAAGSVRICQGRLDQEWAKVASLTRMPLPGGGFYFQTEDEAERKRADEAVANAQAHRAELDATLATDTAALNQAATAWAQLTSTWAPVADGSRDGFDGVPSDGNEVGVITDGDRTIFSTGSGNDDIRVEIDPKTGERVVTVNGQSYRVPDGQDLVIRAGGGTDTIDVPAGTDVDVTLIGGEGNDTITTRGGDDTILGMDGEDKIDAGDGGDRVSGGADADYLDGQGGDDTVVGGSGRDTLYGMGGDDVLSGGEGQDYLEGADGDDRLDGGEGNDILSGGKDDDTIHGGGGDDVTYAGRGHDTTYAGSGNDTSYVEGTDASYDTEKRVTVEIPDTGSFIKVEGSPEFVARVQADLEMLRGSPTGQQMLENLQDNHDNSGFLGFNKESLTIREYPTPDNSTATPSGNDNTIEYSTHFNTLYDGPPSAVLYHEMAHVYDYMNDTLADGTYQGEDLQDVGDNNRERVAAGLPIDDDNDPDTPERIDPRHPYVYTENGLREEMGAPHRDHY